MKFKEKKNLLIDYTDIFSLVVKLPLIQSVVSGSRGFTSRVARCEDDVPPWWLRGGDLYTVARR